MSKQDDAVVAALYGRAYGPAHSDTLINAEAERSALDPTRRLPRAEDDLSKQAGFHPAHALFGAIDSVLGLRPGVAGLPGLDPYDDPDRIDFVESAHEATSVPAEPEFDSVSADDLEQGIDRDLRAWIAANPDAVLTTPALLTGALHLVKGFTNRADEMNLSAAMTRLGYDKAQRRIEGERVWVWVSRTSTSAFTNV